jgi:hypothetical protein
VNIALVVGSDVEGIGNGSAFCGHGTIQYEADGNQLGSTSTIDEHMPGCNVPLVTLPLTARLDED